jgi:Fe-S cluster assembly protein SufD
MSVPARTSATDPYREAFAALRPSLRGDAGQRSAAFARFIELGFPGTRDEAWKYTSLRRLESRRFAPATREAALSATLQLPAPLGDHRLVLANGHWREELGLTGALPAGIRITTDGRSPGAGASAQANAALRLPTGGGTEPFAALNAALTADPLRIEVDPGVRWESPLHVVIVATGEPPVASHPRVSVRMGAGSFGRIVLHWLDDGSVERFVNAAVDVELADRAELHVYRLQACGAKTFHIERFDATVAAGARLAVRDSQLGAALARLDLNVALAGRAAEAELTGMFIADGARHLDTHVHVAHRAIETRSLQDYRGVAAGRGRAVFNGKTIVHEGAQKSIARQSSRNLLLTAGAEIDTKPELEIYADDVQCSHGATTGQLDPAAMFYLRSRGLSESEARSALTRAFTGAVLSRIDHVALARLVHVELDDRLGRLLEQTP